MDTGHWAGLLNINIKVVEWMNSHFTSKADTWTALSLAEHNFCNPWYVIVSSFELQGPEEETAVQPVAAKVYGRATQQGTRD